MKRLPFSYCVVRYCPDRGAGEVLNIGVVLFCKEANLVTWKFEHRFQRLSKAFSGFRGDSYRASLDQLEAALTQFNDARQRTLVRREEHIQSAVDVLRSVVSDAGLSFKIGDALSGITSSPADEVAMLFERMVGSRQPARAEAERRSNEEVWKTVYEPILPADVCVQLTSTKFSTADTEVEFAHAYKNGAWHVVQPLSLDYQTADTVHKRAQEWAGTSLGLQDATGLAKIYFLLGAPQNERLQDAYHKALNLLAKAPVNKQIVEEKDAEEFARTFTDVVRHSHDVS